MKKYVLILGLAFVAPSLAFASFDTSLSYGSSGTAVQQLQQFLVSQNCLAAKPTGYFGSLTLAGVKCFQIKYGISNTGFFGSLSRTMANAVVSRASSSSESYGTQGIQSSVNLSQGVRATPALSPLVGTGSTTVNFSPTVTATTNLSPLVGTAVVPPASSSMSQGANAPAPISPLAGSGH